MDFSYSIFDFSVTFGWSGKKKVIKFFISFMFIESFTYFNVMICEHFFKGLFVNLGNLKKKIVKLP